MSVEIHPTALVDPEAEIGENVHIGAYALIGDRVKIGDECQIDSFAQIKTLTTLGRNNHVHSYACIGGAPQHTRYKGEATSIEIGDNNCIREFVTINRGTAFDKEVTRVGSNCFLMSYCHIAHDCQIGDEVIMANAATLAGHVTVEDKVIIGGLSAVHQFVHIGKHSYVGGMTGVSQDVPPYMLIAGERGWLQGVNVVGLKRHGFDKDLISGLKRAYKLLWRSRSGRKQAMQKVEKELGDTPEIRYLLDFIQNSERGIIGAKGKNNSE